MAQASSPAGSRGDSPRASPARITFRDLSNAPRGGCLQRPFWPPPLLLGTVTVTVPEALLPDASVETTVMV